MYKRQVYDRQTYGEDAYLEHGKAQVVAVEGVYDLYSIPFANNPGDEKGGHIAVEAGKQVTVRLTPDYGYQLKGEMCIRDRHKSRL